MKRFKMLKFPVVLPIFFFMLVILLGAVLLHSAETTRLSSMSWTDTIFTATSAVCVTGLTVNDTGTCFTVFGKTIILCMMQIGGLGIMTITSLFIYLLRRRTTITDRISVGQALLHDLSFNLGDFLMEIVTWTFLIEAMGAILLYWMSPDKFSPFSAVFHSVSAFCNAGFSLFPNNLMNFKGDWGINLVFITLIFLGGIGFSVWVDVKNYILQRCKPHSMTAANGISWYSMVVLKTSCSLIFFGWVAIYFSEFIGYNRLMVLDDAVLTALFQSVTCRTAGFNTLDMGQMTNVSLVIFLFLMFVGGAPGSCAGGIKVTTFRVLIAAIWSQLKGKKQTVIGKFAVSEATLKKAMVLFILSIALIFFAVFLLDFTEGGDKPHYQVRGQYLELLFESVSAFCTVGLSTGVTSTLSTAGKWILIFLMFVGRLGPFVLISAVLSFQEIPYYSQPEENLMIG